MLDRLVRSLCTLTPVCLPSGIRLRDSCAMLVVPAVGCCGSCDAMFRMIHQGVAGSPAY